PSGAQNHIAGWFRDGPAYPHGRGHALLDHIPGARSRQLAWLAHSTFFDLGNARGDPNDNPGTYQALAAMHFGDKVAQHGHGAFKVRNHSATQGANDLDSTRNPTQHALGLIAHGQNTVTTFHETHD